MTEHYVVDSGSRLKAWDVNAYTQAIVTATKEGKIVDVDSAVKIGNEWEVRYTLSDTMYEAARKLTETLAAAEESHKNQVLDELAKMVVASPEVKATQLAEAVAEPVTPPEPEVTPEPAKPEVEQTGDILDQAPPPAEPKPKATRKRRAPKTS